jgi:hypothetical protein
MLLSLSTMKFLLLLLLNLLSLSTMKLLSQSQW